MSENEFIKISSPNGLMVVTISPKIGGSIASFTFHQGERTVNIMRPYDEKRAASPLNFASFPLTPFSNRIGYGKLAFAGENFSINTPFVVGDHPLHGDGLLRPWTVVRQSPHEVTLTLESESAPYKYKAAQTYALGDDGLSIHMALTNEGDRRLPFGLGHHPYFPRTDNTILKLNAPQVWRSENMLPVALEPVPAKMNFSQGLALNDKNLSPADASDSGTAYIDHCFPQWDRVAEIFWPEDQVKLTMTADPIFENFVLYVPSDDQIFCAEAVSHINDGFNLREQGAANTGTIILAPGETMQGTTWFKPARYTL